MSDPTLTQIAASLQRIADRLEAIAPAESAAGPVLTDADAYHWDAAADRLMPVPKVSRVPFGLLKGIDSVRDTLLANTLQFARGYAANNALLVVDVLLTSQAFSLIWARQLTSLGAVGVLIYGFIWEVE